MKMLMIHDVAASSAKREMSTEAEYGASRGLRMDAVLNNDVKELWNEFKNNETYEAKVAHAITRLVDQIEL